ncbi:ribonuclease HI [Microbulbifer epialgicus]|uniref:Ribonuclease H n=1 Tax=Microbulbifer epialgicus TaxID=393907 RepID=A0ABV4NTS9_9GAMM
MTVNITIYTDGACRGNPGPGGWGAVIKHADWEYEISGGDAETTNNKMELLAAIKALEVLEKVEQKGGFVKELAVEIYTDSQYVRQGITNWIKNWKRNGWKSASRKPVKNADLWRSLEKISSKYNVEWHWVKGHAGHPGNERADRLATSAIGQPVTNKSTKGQNLLVE